MFPCLIESHIATWGWVLIALGIAGVLLLIGAGIWFVVQRQFHLIVIPRDESATEEWGA